MAETGSLEAQIQPAATREEGKAGQAVGFLQRHQIIRIKPFTECNAGCGCRRAVFAQQLLLPELGADGRRTVAIALLVGEFVGHEFLFGRTHRSGPLCIPRP